MRFCKIRDVKSPERGTGKSAGIDFFIPNDYNGPVLLGAHSDLLIPSGIKAEIPEGYALIAFNKSGIATSKQACIHAGRRAKPEAFASAVVIGACVVDEDYQGEIHIHIINTGSRNLLITPGMKIAQFILLPVNYATLEEVSPNELFSQSTKRGEGAFGHTGSY